MKLYRQILDFFDDKAKKQLIILFFLMLLGSVLEAFSVGLILPFIAIVSNANEIQSFQAVKRLYEIINPSSYRDFLILFGIGMLAVYVFKNIFLLIVTYFQNRFIYHQQAIISRNLLSCYLYSPYSFHLQRNTAELIRNLTMSLGSVFGGAVIPFMTILTEVPVILSISILLLVVKPSITILACVIIGGLSGVFYKYVRRKTGYYGSMVQETGANKIGRAHV